MKRGAHHAPLTKPNKLCIMTERQQRLESELMQFANECKAAGLRVFFSEWNHSVGRKTYFHASDGIGIAYVANSDTNFGYFTLSISYKPSVEFGTDCNILDWEEWREPKVQDVINACGMRTAPEWLLSRVNKRRKSWQRTAPTFYKDVDEWIEAQSKFCKIVEL